MQMMKNNMNVLILMKNIQFNLKNMEHNY